jgi:hypothetical protein
MRYREEEQDTYLESFDIIGNRIAYTEIIPDTAVIKLIHNKSDE